MSSSKITIKEVAKEAGVSIASVSRFFSNPSSLKEENYRKVEKAVKQLSYEPLIYARRLAGGKLNIFGLIIPGYEEIFYSFYAWEIIKAVTLSLEKEGIDLHLHIFWNRDNFKDSVVDGVIFADVIGNENQLQRLIRKGLPLVVINKKIDDLEVNYVAINNFNGGYQATEFLINYGHKRIAHLAGDIQVQCAQERLDGYRHALEKNGIEIKEEYIKITNFSPKIVREKLEELFSLKEVPTAVFACSDEVASEVLAYSKEKKIKIPASLSIVGFDDNLRYGNLMLTTVRQPLGRMASLGVEILKKITEKKMSPQRVVLEPELIIRNTVDFV